MQLAGMTFDKNTQQFHKVYRHRSSFIRSDGTKVHDGHVWTLGSPHFARVFGQSSQSQHKSVHKIGYTRRGEVYSVCELRRGKPPAFREARGAAKSRDQQLEGTFYEMVPGRSDVHKVCAFQYRDGTRVSSRDKIMTPPGKPVHYV